MRRERLLLLAVRVGLPVALVIAGIVLIVIGGGGHATADTGLDTNAPTTSAGSTTATGVVLIGVGLVVWMINWLYRMTISSGDDRDAEERRRDYYSRHGHWPGEGGE